MLGRVFGREIIATLQSGSEPDSLLELDASLGRLLASVLLRVGAAMDISSPSFESSESIFLLVRVARGISCSCSSSELSSAIRRVFFFEMLFGDLRYTFGDSVNESGSLTNECGDGGGDEEEEEQGTMVDFGCW